MKGIAGFYFFFKGQMTACLGADRKRLKELGEL